MEDVNSLLEMIAQNNDLSMSGCFYMYRTWLEIRNLPVTDEEDER